MKCPVCQAVLLPVAGEMFCLQCGNAVAAPPAGETEAPSPEETTDPLLRRALSDATDGDIVFKDAAPVMAAAQAGGVAQAADAPRKRSFSSLGVIMAPPRLGVTGGALTLPQADLAPSQASFPSTAETKPVRGRFRFGMVRAWLIGLAGLGVFVGVNLGIGAYYANRVYPGVRVSGVAVGGVSFAQLGSRLPAAVKRPKLSAEVGGVTIDLGLSSDTSADSADLEKRVRAAGRSTALPAVALVSTWSERPLAPNYRLSESALGAAVARLAGAVEYKPSDAAVLIRGTNVFVLADKDGQELDSAAAGAAIRSAYGRQANITLSATKLEPEVKADDVADEAAAAQAVMATVVHLNVKKATYSPTPAQIATWVVLLGPGKGVSVDPAGVAGYVKGIPGSFDRVAAVSALVAALNAKQGLAITASTKKVTANPTPASLILVGPVARYTYCLKAGSTSANELESDSAKALGTGGGWAQGGLLQFTLVRAGCNFTIRLADARGMAALDSACAKQTTCRLHNEAYILDAAWKAPPATWNGDTESYRVELINQVTGQWLGFDHPSCIDAARQTPVLATPSLQVAGCSPSWYAVPSELQDTKILPGFE